MVVILQSRGFITISYNLGTEDINIAEESKPLNDGGYHVIRLVCLWPVIFKSHKFLERI